MNATPTNRSATSTSSTPQTLPSSTSTWVIGWRTPFMIMFCYILAILFACTHLGLFIYLDGKPANGETRVAPQSYIITASSILTAVFGLSLKSSLAISSTQYLWYILRRSVLKVSTIESLFALQSNPFLLFNRLVLIDGYFLIIIAILIWSIQVVVSFPPGALTIGSSTRIWTQNQSVPSFNASYFGNSSGYDADRFSFYGFSAGISNLTIYPNLLEPGGSTGSPFLKNLVDHTLVSGNPTNMPSPCNANCSFTLVMEAPYLKCNSTSSNTTFYSSPEDPFSPAWADTFDATWRFHILNITTYYKVISDVFNYITKIENNICAPARATYALDILYENNIQSMNYSLASVTSLNITPPTPPTSMTGLSDTVFPGFMLDSLGNSICYYGLQALNWTEPIVSWYRDIQLMSLIDSLGISLAGSMQYGGYGNSTIVANSRFNHAFGIYPQPMIATLDNFASLSQIDSEPAAMPQSDQYTVTQDSLNEVLLNITLSAIVNFGWWQTNTVVKRWQAINVYEFSRPLNLLIPYFFSLFLSIPILVLGGFALQKNGVSATNGGFIQLISTSTGSSTLDKLAAGGCLGGNENIPQDLKDLKIRFGEVVSEGEKGLVRRAGFGTEKEIRPLKKGTLYGYSD